MLALVICCVYKNEKGLSFYLAVINVYLYIMCVEYYCCVRDLKFQLTVLIIRIKYLK